MIIYPDTFFVISCRITADWGRVDKSMASMDQHLSFTLGQKKVRCNNRGAWWVVGWSPWTTAGVVI